MTRARAALFAFVVLAALLPAAHAARPRAATPPPAYRPTPLYAADGWEGYRFGAAIAVEGDLAAIAAPGWGAGEGDLFFGKGAVYLYRREASGWMQAGLIPAPLAQDGLYFGRALALDGDRLAVLASGEDVGEPGQPGYHENGGAIYLYRHQGATWQPDGRVVPDNFGPLQRLGSAIALNGDTLAATFSDRSDLSETVVFFQRQNGGWAETGRLTAPSDGPSFFGEDVALAGDVALVGAPGSPGYAMPGNRGVVYVYGRGGGAWSPSGTLTPDEGEDGDNFGCAIDFGEGAGELTVAVAACSIAEPGVGDRVYLFERDSGDWAQIAQLEPSHNDALDIADIDYGGDQLAVATREDYTQDTRVAGAAFLFERDGAAWTQRTLPPVDRLPRYDLFSSVALAGPEVLAGYRFANRRNVADTGAVYVFAPIPAEGVVYLPSLARPALQRTTGLIAYLDGGLILADADGRGWTRVAGRPDYEVSSFTWSPDGRRIAFIDFEGGKRTLSVYDLATGAVTPIASLNLSNAYSPTWSPDGARLAFVATVAEYYDLFAIGADGQGLVQLTSTYLIDEVWPDWSPDGTRIAFKRDGALATMNAGGGDVRVLNPGDVGSPGSVDWSPDGQTLLYTCHYGQDLCTIPASGGTPRLLVRAAAGGRWSPDGTQILMEGMPGTGLYRVAADGTGLTDILPFGDSPAWQP